MYSDWKPINQIIQSQAKPEKRTEIDFAGLNIFNDIFICAFSKLLVVARIFVRLSSWNGCSCWRPMSDTWTWVLAQIYAVGQTVCSWLMAHGSWPRGSFPAPSKLFLQRIGHLTMYAHSEKERCKKLTLAMLLSKACAFGHPRLKFVLRSFKAQTAVSTL